eukprot:191901-Pelagomonas_calceolata.AAC.6
MQEYLLVQKGRRKIKDQHQPSAGKYNMDVQAEGQGRMAGRSAWTKQQTQHFSAQAKQMALSYPPCFAPVLIHRL